MSAPHSNALDAVGIQLVAALGAYEADVAHMIETWPDLDRYRDVSEQVERIRMYSSALGDARVQWVEMLIAHSELVHYLWQAPYGRPDAPEDPIELVRAHHSEAVAGLRARCARVMARSHNRAS